MQKEKKIIDAKNNGWSFSLPSSPPDPSSFTHTWFNWHCNCERTSDKNELNNNKKEPQNQQKTKKKEKPPTNY